MPREIGECPRWPEDVDHHPGFESRAYEIQIITPIFGGGAEASVNDPVTIIRPSSIRGHLRFWWRATRGARCNTTADLQKREAAIWGTMENPSQVIVEVEDVEHGDPSECAKYEWDQTMRRGEGGYRLNWLAPFDSPDKSLPYVLFPFQGKDKNAKDPKDPSKMVRTARFKLIARFPSDSVNNIKTDVEAAVWAWVNFGGIGARTRRGCGALYCAKPPAEDPDLTPSSVQNFKDWMNRCFSRYGILMAPAPREWPVLGNVYLSNKIDRSPNPCWRECVGSMKDLRQGVDLGRDPGSRNKPSRSRWPEPESVRKIAMTQNGWTVRPKGLHPPDGRMRHIAFPRAEFGMPMIIEIRGEGLKPTLQPNEDHDRMASPLILRPIGFTDGRFAPMITRMITQPLTSAYLKPDGKYLKSGRSISGPEITDTSLSAFPESPRHKFGATGSALDAFIAYAGTRGFGKVFP